MKIRMNGKPEDLIQRCENCKYCVFEEILKPDQRRISVLQKTLPDEHVHRDIIEQLCGKQYDDVCPMKYAAMRALCNDRTAAQLGVVKNYVWDLGKQFKRRVDFTKAMHNWTKDQDLGRGIMESYAQRFRDIWNKGIREITVDEKRIKKQILTADYIYEVVMADAQTYEITLIILDTLIREHKERDKI